MPLVFGLFGRFRPPPALTARCGIVVRRRIHFPGRPFAWSRSGERCQGFSPLQPRCRFSVQHDSAGWRGQRLRTPCADRLGEQTKRQRLGHVIVAPRPDSIASWQSSLVHRARAPHLSRTCLALTKAQDPTRLPRIRFLGPITSQTCLADSSPRGLRRPFDLCLPGAPFCGGQRPPAPFRATGLLNRSTLRLVRPHGQPSDTAPRCFESVSTTDVSRHEHPCRNITLGDCRRAPWETRRRSTSRSPVGTRTLLALAIPRATPDHLAVIRPPTASRLTARCRLRADRLPRSCAWREVG